MPHTFLGTGATAVNKPDQIPALKELTASEAWVANPFSKCETKAQRDDSLLTVTPRGSGKARVRTLTSAKTQKALLMAPNTGPNLGG